MASTLAGITLVGLSFWLVRSHLKVRRNDPRADLPQFRRRMFTSLLLGAVGCAIVVGKLIVAAAQPLLFVAFWLAVLAMALLAGFGGFVDLVATRRRLRREKHGHITDIHRLEVELANAVAEQQRGGKAHVRNGRKR